MQSVTNAVLVYYTKLHIIAKLRNNNIDHTHSNEEVKKVDVETGPSDIGQSVAESLERTDPKPIRRSQLCVLGLGEWKIPSISTFQQQLFHSTVEDLTNLNSLGLRGVQTSIASKYTDIPIFFTEIEHNLQTGNTEESSIRKGVASAVTNGRYGNIYAEYKVLLP